MAAARSCEGIFRAASLARTFASSAARTSSGLARLQTPTSLPSDGALITDVSRSIFLVVISCLHVLLLDVLSLDVLPLDVFIAVQPLLPCRFQRVLRGAPSARSQTRTGYASAFRSGCPGRAGRCASP